MVTKSSGKVCWYQELGSVVRSKVTWWKECTEDTPNIRPKYNKLQYILCTSTTTYIAFETHVCIACTQISLSKDNK